MKIAPIALLGLVLFACASAPESESAAVDNPWAKVAAPTAGPAHSIGKAGAGCLSGAISLAPDGPGYEMMRISRKRFYGNPAYVHFIENLGRAIADKKAPTLLVGDIGQARGGPTPTGHLSHQIGLDGDIWYTAPAAGAGKLSLDDRERFSAKSVVKKDQSGLQKAFWDESRDWILLKAVSYGEVERIFVNPVIKRELCKKYPTEPTLAKLRAWWGHDDHFHVRLKCPKGDAGCESTPEAIPPGNGCDASLDWWFGPEAKVKGEENTKKYTVHTLPKLPAECDAILRQSEG